MAEKTANALTKDELTSVVAEGATVDDESAEIAETEAWNEFEAADKAAEDRGAAASGEPAPDGERPPAEPQPGKAEGDSEDHPPGEQPPGEEGDEEAAGTGDGAAASDADIWENATPAQKAAFLAAQTTAERATQQYRSSQGRANALQRQLDSATTAAAPKGDAADAAPGATEGAQDAEGLFGSDDWTSFQDEYPEVAAPIKGVIGKLVGETETLKTRVGGISARAQNVDMAAETVIVMDAHPDYDQIAKSDAFELWFGAQPAYVQEGIRRNADAIVDGTEVADIVARFKEDPTTGYSPGAAGNADAADKGNGKGGNTDQETGESAIGERRKRQLEGAHSPSSTGPAPVRDGVDETDEQALWDGFERAGL